MFVEAPPHPPALRIRNTCIDKALCDSAKANSLTDIYNSYKSIYGSNHKKQPGSNRGGGKLSGCDCKSGNIFVI